MAPENLVILLGTILFSAGVTIIIVKKNMIMMLMGIELMLNASNLNLVAFNRLYPDTIDGQTFALFVIIVAVCETATGLAIILYAYRQYRTSLPEQISELKG